MEAWRAVRAAAEMQLSGNEEVASVTPDARRPDARQRINRWLWMLGGFGAAAVGLIGIALPVIPTTGPFIVAAACFARSSPRLEAWVLGLPGVGAMVNDFRAGLGMPRPAKIIAILMIVIAVGASATLAPLPWWARAGALLLGAVGVGYIALRVPTRETVVSRRQAEPDRPA